MPSRGPRGQSARRAASLAAAWSSASGVTAITAPSAGFTAAMRSRQRWVSAVAVSPPTVIACRSPATEDEAISKLVPGISGASPDEIWKSGMRAG